MRENNLKTLSKIIQALYLRSPGGDAVAPSVLPYTTDGAIRAAQLSAGTNSQEDNSQEELHGVVCAKEAVLNLLTIHPVV